MPCEAPVMTATFISALMAISFMLPMGWLNAGQDGGSSRNRFGRIWISSSEQLAWHAGMHWLSRINCAPEGYRDDVPG
jgi:hypothetical protein